MKGRLVPLRRLSSAFAALLCVAVPTIATALPQMTERSAKAQEKRSKEILALSADAVANSVSISDDDLETVATITTATAFMPKRGSFFDTLLADNMLRAMVGKATGRTSWQLYQTMTYSDPERRDFTSVNYETPTGPKNEPLTIINRDVRCNYGICTYEETVGFNVQEELLEAIVKQSAGKPGAVWRFRLNARNGVSWTDDMPVEEIMGALTAVSRYRTRKGLE